MGCAPCEQRQARLLQVANTHGGLIGLALLTAVVVFIFAPKFNHHTRSHR